MDFKIDSHIIGTGFPPLFLPDVGTFFNQDVRLAKEIIDQLFDAGIRIVKGELLHSAEICLKEAGDEAYLGRKSGKLVTEDYRALIERKVVSLDSYEELITYASGKGVSLVMSVYDKDGVDFALSNGISALKASSSNITHQPLIEDIANSGLPLILDTGHSTLEEAARAVSWAHDADVTGLVIQHSPLPPPAHTNQHNLKFMQTLGGALGVPYGLSDHHRSEEMLYAATAMGASILEKGVCPDELGDEQDGVHALALSKVGEVTEKIKNISMAMGNGVRHLRQDRPKYKSRMGLIAKHDLAPGDCIDRNNVTFAFPAKGIGTEYWSLVQGKKLVAARKQGTVISWDHV